MEKYFGREFQVDSVDRSLELLQHTVGDVGCVVWDAALVLAGYLDVLNRTKSFKGLNILELGSGTGCVGLVAAALGAKVTITDLVEMVPLIRKNVVNNKLNDAAKVQAFQWGSDSSNLLPEGQTFDMVLAADCIYYKESLEAFIKSLEDTCPLGGKTEILLSYEERESDEKKKLIETFTREIEKNFIIIKVPIDQYRQDFACEDIHILKIVRK